MILLTIQASILSTLSMQPELWRFPSTCSESTAGHVEMRLASGFGCLGAPVCMQHAG